jgi:hypothetical protein
MRERRRDHSFEQVAPRKLRMLNNAQHEHGTPVPSA